MVGVEQLHSCSLLRVAKKSRLYLPVDGYGPSKTVAGYHSG
jgi:hypothetical protein